MGGRGKKHKKAAAAAAAASSADPAQPPPAPAEEAEAEQECSGHAPEDDAVAHHRPLSPKQPSGSPHRASTKHRGKHHHRHRRRNPDPDPSEQKQEDVVEAEAEAEPAPAAPANAAPDAPPPQPPSPEPPLRIFRGEWMRGFHLLLPVGDRLLLRVRRQTARNFSMIQCLYWKDSGDGDGAEAPSLSLIDEWKVQGAVEGGARVGLECKWSGESAVVLYVLPTKKTPNVVFYCYTMSIYTAVGDFAMEHVRLNRTLRQTFKVEEPTNTTHVALEDGTAVCYAEPSGAVAVYTLRLCPTTLAVQLSLRPRTLRALHAHYTHVALRPSRRGRHEVICFSQTTGATAIHPLVFGTDEQLQAYAAVVEGTRPQPEERRRCSRMVVVPGCQEAPSAAATAAAAAAAAPEADPQQQPPCEDAVDSTASTETAAAAPFPPRAASTILFYKHFVRAENPACLASPMAAAAVVMATARGRPPPVPPTTGAAGGGAADGELLEFQKEKQGGDAAGAGGGGTARGAAQQDGGGGGGPNPVDAGLLKLSHRMSDTVLLPRLVETFAFLWTAVVPWPVAAGAACDRRPAVVCYEECSGAVLIAEVLQQARKILVDSGKNARWLSPPRRARERHAAAAARSYFCGVPTEMAGLTTAAVATSPPRRGGCDEPAAELPPPHAPTRYQADILAILRGMKGRPRDVRTDYYLESAAKEVVSRDAYNSQSLNPVALCLEAAADGCGGEAAAAGAGASPRDWGAAAAIARLQNAKLAAFDTLADGEAASRSDPPALRRARHAQARNEKPLWVHCSKPPARIVTPPLGCARQGTHKHTQLPHHSHHTHRDQSLADRRQGDGAAAEERGEGGHRRCRGGDGEASDNGADVARGVRAGGAAQDGRSTRRLGGGAQPPRAAVAAADAEEHGAAVQGRC